MGQVHKIGDEYYIEFYARGLLYQQKAGGDPQKAAELLRQVEEKIARGELQTISRDIDVDIFFAEFIKYAQSLYHPHTIRRLQSTVDHFQKFFNHHYPKATKLSEVTPRVAEDYKAFLFKSFERAVWPLNAKAINLTILLLREILEYGIKTGSINDNPTLHVRLLDIKEAPPSMIDAGQFDAFVNQLRESYRSACVLMRYAGLRLTDVADLTWQQVDFDRNVIFVKSREIPLTPVVLSFFKDGFANVIDHKAPVVGERLDIHQFLSEMERLQISLSVFRHSFARDLLQKKISLLAVGKILGIYDIAKIMFYAAYIPSQRHDILS